MRTLIKLQEEPDVTVPDLTPKMSVKTRPETPTIRTSTLMLLLAKRKHVGPGERVKMILGIPTIVPKRSIVDRAVARLAMFMLGAG